MNKEEIEDKEHLMKVLTEYKDYIFEFDDDNIKIEYILDYIKELEFQNTALKKEHEYDVKMIDNVKGEAVKLYKEIDRLNDILDKVTDKLKEDIEINNFRETLCLEDKGRYYYGKELLNIIEGEKK